MFTAIYADTAYCIQTADQAIKETSPQAGARNVEVPKRKNTIELTTPLELTQPDTEYILKNDINSAATAFVVRASNITINLNGFRIHYLTQDGSLHGSAVQIPGRQKDIDILNGEIVQGPGRCIYEEAVPECSAIYAQDVNDLQVAGLKITYSTQNSPAISVLTGKDVRINNNSLNDGGVQTAKTVISVIDARNIIALKVFNNSIKSRRQSGIRAGAGSEIYQNDITLYNTKSQLTAISASGIIHRNRIFVEGPYVAGLNISGAGKIYLNHLQTRVTKRNDDPADASGACIKVGPGSENIEAYGNTFNLYTESERALSSAVHVGLNNPEHKALFHNNNISAIGRSSKVRAAAITIGSNNESRHIVFRNNKITSNWTNIVLGDATGHVSGYPAFVENTISRSDSYPAYNTVKGLNQSKPATACFYSNKYENGASKENLDLDFDAGALKEICFGWTIDIAVTKAGKPVSGASVTIKDASGATVFEGLTNEKGALRSYLAEYALTNAGLDKQAHQKIVRPSKLPKTPHKIIIKKNGYTEEKSIRAESDRIVIISLQ
ncbi:MAG: hypothetical protein LLF86_09280 [Nitrospiraceae bacterium]|nr:hypothetical protein [Nitrospiraceae bacterium]